MKRQLIGLDPYPDDDGPGEDNRGPRAGPFDTQAIYDVLERMGHESLRQTISQRKAHNEYVAAHPELGWLPIHVPPEPGACETASGKTQCEGARGKARCDGARPPPGME